MPRQLWLRGKYLIRQAACQADLIAAQSLRAQAFRSANDDGLDCDIFDERCLHFLVIEAATGTLVCCFRLLPLQDGREISSSYSAQYYELTALESYPHRMAELGRFCIRPGYGDPDIIRVAWGAMTTYVDESGIGLLFGCSSFAGTETKDYLDTFAMLQARHLAPPRWLPRIKAPDVFRFAARLRRKPDVKKAMMRMPPLLRTYLLMGGWVSDHAVVDRNMNTLHVFTGLEITAIPPARKKLLRAVAGQGSGASGGSIYEKMIGGR